MTGKSKKISFPVTRLSELIGRPGGVSCDEAVAEALRAIEALRADCNLAIVHTIGDLEKLVCSAKGDLGVDVLKQVLAYSDRIVTLSGTYGYTNLDTVAKALCDLADGLSRAAARPAEPVIVHVSALRLLAPDRPALPEEAVAKVLTELAKVRAHFRAGEPLDAAPAA